MKGAIADGFVDAVIEIGHRREAQVDAEGAQLRGHQPASRAREFESRLVIGIELMADEARRGQCREPLAKALHPATLVIHGDDQRGRSDRLNVGDQARQLLGIGKVAREKNDAADEWVRQHLALFGIERDAAQIDHEWTQRHYLFLHWGSFAPLR